MDTCADRTQAYQKPRSHGHAAITKEDPEKQKKEGHCFTCNKQGHIARNCPDKPSGEKRPQTKAKKAETEDSDCESDTETWDGKGPITPDAYIRLGKTLKEEDKIAIVKMAVRAEQGEEGGDMDF